MSFRIIAPSRPVLSRLTYRQHLATLSCLVSAVGFCASLSTAQAQTATAAKKSSQLTRASSTTSAAHARPRSTKAIEAHGAEEISVGSTRRKRNGGGGMMRLETAPHAVQTVTKEYIDMRSPVSTALDLVKNLPSVNVTTPDTSGMQGGQVQTPRLTNRDIATRVAGLSAA